MPLALPASSSPASPVSRRVELAREIAAARARADALFALVRPESFYDRPIPERHRIIFYLGHLEAFDWNLLGTGWLGLPSFHPQFDRLFAFGIDPEPGKLPEDSPSDWPQVEEVLAYNRRVRETVDHHLGALPEQRVHVAVEHRLMHVETFAYMLHSLSVDAKNAPVPAAAKSGSRPVPAMLDVGGGAVTLGRNAEEGFGWDNEFEPFTVLVPSFSVGQFKVTNAEYLRFVQDGGSPPHFWRFRSGEWYWRRMFGEIPLPLDWPVYVTHRQASEYAKWAGKRLLSEREFHLAAWGPNGESSAQADPERDNFDGHRFDPVPVTDSADGTRRPEQMVGNGWEWTASVFEPFPGFKPFSFYPNYSAPFFDGQHYVLKGASPITPSRLARRSFRNWFRPNYPYVYATFRVAED